jgi:hypothetical protein
MDFARSVESVHEEKIIDILKYFLDYPSDIIKYKLDELVTYGLVSFITDGESKRSHLRITVAGEFMKWLSLNKPDLLMYLALDTPLPIRLAKILANTVISTNEVGQRLRFTESMPYVSTAFLSVVCYFQREEAKKVRERAANQQAYEMDEEEICKMFEIVECEKIHQYVLDLNRGKLTEANYNGINRPNYEDYSETLMNIWQTLHPVKANGFAEATKVFYLKNNWEDLMKAAHCENGVG